MSLDCRYGCFPDVISLWTSTAFWFPGASMLVLWGETWGFGYPTLPSIPTAVPVFLEPNDGGARKKWSSEGSPYPSGTTAAPICEKGSLPQRLGFCGLLTFISGPTRRLLVARGVRKQRRQGNIKKTTGLYPLSLTLGIPFLILSWDRTKGLLPGLSLSAFGAHFQVWGCSEFKPGEYHMWKYGRLNTGLVVLQILVIPTLPATVHSLESLHSCSVHSLQVLELRLPGEAGWGMPTPADLEPKPKTTLSEKLNWVCQ